ncbi:MAG: hypothetical protein LBN22_08010 [Clostridiales Family XIII bacterium]|nr:hypothetical protein [Clostridiales Family XIII bacterium]
MNKKQGKPIVLTGPDYDSTLKIASLLAEKLSFMFLDVNREIERRDGRSVQRIHMLMGEHEVHNLEDKILDEIVDEGKPVIAAFSQGIVLDPQNRDILRSDSVRCVWIDLSEALLKALGYDNRAADRYRMRRPLFEEVSDISAEDADELLEKLTISLVDDSES